MFSPNHRQHLMVAFRHLDEALDEVLQRLGAPAGAPLFARLRDDVDPLARERASCAVDGVRDAVRGFMARHDMLPAEPDLGAVHAANARLGMALVSAEELGPRHLRGYGELTPEEAEELAVLSESLCARIGTVINALPERRGRASGR